MAAPSRALEGADGPPLGRENAPIKPLGQYNALRWVAPSTSTTLRSAVAKRTRAHEVSVIAVDRWHRLGGKSSITCMQPW
jgi:hypothetical protein